jgi:hypothetical protein
METITLKIKRFSEKEKQHFLKQNWSLSPDTTRLLKNVNIFLS